LAEARGERDRYNRLLRDHVDPIEHRKRQRAEAALADAATITFKEAAAAYCTAHRAGLKNLKSAAQWVSTLATYAEPVIGDLSVRDINTGHIHRVLEPIWSAKSDTASKLRGRIEAVLDWARVKGYRDGENPARWKGNLDHLLPKPSKVRKVEHHAALPYAELPAFMEKLRQQEGAIARALEFTVLTASRLGEALNATAQEIDHSNKLWLVPGSRMKGGVEHRVPLCKRALEFASVGNGGHLFPSRYSTGKPVSDMMLRLMLRQLGYDGITIHGFRATFKTWAMERTRFENFTVEAALAHTSGDKKGLMRGPTFSKSGDSLWKRGRNSAKHRQPKAPTGLCRCDQHNSYRLAWGRPGQAVASRFTAEMLAPRSLLERCAVRPCQNGSRRWRPSV
jgi:integrase